MRVELVLYLNILNDNLVKSRRLKTRLIKVVYECFWYFDIVLYNFAQYQQFVQKEIHFPTDLSIGRGAPTALSTPYFMRVPLGACYDSVTG